MTRSTRRADLAEQWASDLSALAYDRIPSATLECIKLLVLDSLGTALAASTLADGGEELSAFARSQASSCDCTLIGLGARASVLTAAFVNGALIHALNYDALGMDGGHVGLAAVPTPLALAESQNSGGKDLLVAICAGAEFTCRLAAALHKAGVKHENRFLEGQVLGYFGATAAAARLLRFDPPSMHSALGFALMQASGTRQVSIEGGAAKAIYGGFPNLGAVVSTTMAAHSAGARCSFLEGEAGLYNLFFDGRYERAVLADGFTDEFLTSRLAFKPWPISSVVQPFVEAALSIRQRARISSQDVKRIRLLVHQRARGWIEPFKDRCRPATAATASNSIPFCLGKALAAGRLALEDFGPGVTGLGDQRAARIAESIEYSFVEDATAIGGNGRIVIELRGDAIISADVSDQCSVPGADALVAKFRDCAKYALTPIASSNLEAIVEQIMDLEHLRDVAMLARLLQNHG